MKKVFIVCLLFLLSGCSKTTITNHEFINDENYLDIMNLMNQEDMYNNEKWMVKIIEDRVGSTISSETIINTYNFFINSNKKTFIHTIDTNTIEMKNNLTNETTTFKDNIEVTSLEHFTSIILDSYKDEFSYYSMKHFLPLAKELTLDENFDFYYQKDYFEMKEYRLTGTIDELNLEETLHNALLETSSIYKEVYNQKDLKITLTFKTDLECKYFYSNIEFKINDELITQII